jgi:hypothetical protein
MRHESLRCTALVMIAVALGAVGCSASVDSTPSTRPSPVTTAAPGTPQTTITGSTKAPSSGPSSVAGVTARVMGSGRYPAWTVTPPTDWSVVGNLFVVKYPTDQPGPVMGLSVWDVGLVFRDPCHWDGQAFDPGPTVDDLVAALAVQPMRNATKPEDVRLAGYAGRYLVLSVPADMTSTKWTEFDECDVDSDGARDFQGWLGNGMGNRYEQVPGQIDELWVLDVNGQRLVVDATYSPDTSDVARDELRKTVDSIRFVTL